MRASKTSVFEKLSTGLDSRPSSGLDLFFISSLETEKKDECGFWIEPENLNVSNKGDGYIDT